VAVFGYSDQPVWMLLHDEISVSVVNLGPVVNILPVPGICSGSSVLLTASVTGGTSPYSYLWGNGATTSFVNVSRLLQLFIMLQ